MGCIRRRPVALVVTLVLVLAAAACGNSDESTERTTTTAPTGGGGGGSTTTAPPDEHVPDDAPGVDDEEIRVGGVASVTSPTGGRYGESFNGVKAYFDMINEAGGIYGRQLKLVAERDDTGVNNKAEVQGLLAQEDIFAVLPIATLLFTGADELVNEGIPTFGWTINPEWAGSAENPKANLFGQTGSYLCFTCANPFVPWLVHEAGRSKVGMLGYSVPQSAECVEGMDAGFDEYGERVGAEVVFKDASLAYGVQDLSVQVSKMKSEGVDFVLTCMDNNAVVTLAKEMKKQRLDAIQYMPNSYDQDFLDEFGDLFEGSYARTDFVQFEVPEEQQPDMLKEYLSRTEEAGNEPTENGLVGWLNADLFVTGLREAGPDFDQQKVIDAINRLTDYDGGGIIHPVDWTKAHTEEPDENDSCQFISVIEDSEFVPEYTRPGKPFVCPVVEPDGLGTRYSN
jgi:ABC-type branched-subunit amino acid transport system substrate-binding protein